MVLGVIPKFYDLINLPRLIYLGIVGIIAIYGLINLNISLKNIVLRNWPAILLLFAIIITSITSNNSWQFNLTGSYQRNNGLIAYLGLTLLLIYISASSNDFLEKIMKHSAIAITIFAIYCTLQLLNLDFLPWNNPYNRIIGTVGNPNFSAALLGMLATSLIFISQKINKYFKYTLGAFIILLSILTNSLQGPLTAILGVMVYFSMINYQKFSKLIISVWSGLLTLIILIILSLTNVIKINQLNEFILKSGSGENRIDYWEAGIKIFLKYPIFGVGPNSYQQYFGEFRSLRQVLRDGANIRPDQAHSVFIEMLADGGLVLGISWIIFASFITLRIIKSVRNNNENLNLLAGFSAIWIAYLIQSLISIDNLALTFFGFIGAGGVLALTSSVIGENPLEKQDRSVLKILMIAPSLAVIFIVGREAILDFNLNNLIRSKTSTAVDFDNFSKNSGNAQTDVMIANYLQQNGDFKIALNVATRGAKRAARFSDNLYLKAVSESKLGDSNSGLKSINQALSYDPLNTYYMVKKANIEFELGDLSASKKTIEKIYKIKPNEVGFAELIDLINQKKK